MVTAVVGANWGDEGKGKITDMLGEESDIIVRFQGGSNAGHTIVNDYGKFALHILPSGVFYNHTTSVIGNGVALNIPDLFKEIQGIVDRGVPMPKIKVSDRAQIVMPYHILFDQYEEERLAGKSFGSTKSGIAPFYSDKYAKVGIQVSELFDEELLREKLERICVQKNVILEHLYHKPTLNVDELMDTLREYRKMVEPYVCDVSAFLYEAREQGKRILLEGQLGSLKDPDHGIYPMVTSSSTLAGYGAVGAGLPPYEIKRIVTVVKAYSSAVGAGEFVSEIFGEEADELRRRGGDGGEYGATTGRPRRMGWFDAVASRYGCRIQGATEVALTVLDVLGYLDELPVCVGYEIDGEVVKEFPVTTKLAKAKPVYEVLPGWACDISGIKEYVIQLLKKQISYRELLALDHVSFNVYKGEVVGIIGTNGSGKSTLLKIVSGALKPSSGEVQCDRRKVQLLTLGTGFDVELTAKENVYLNGAIIGYSKEFIDSKYDEIVRFAELEGFMEEKVKNFSSGMVSRLGFAIATIGETAEILILDEVLSVGDEFFRKKSLKRVQEMIHGGSTVLLVSHSMGTILENCDRVVWIEKGKMKMCGEPKVVCEAYRKMNLNE